MGKDAINCVSQTSCNLSIIIVKKIITLGDATNRVSTVASHTDRLNANQVVNEI